MLGRFANDGCGMDTPGSHLTTIDEVLEHLGGTRAVQRLTGLKSVQAVWEWKNRGVIAARFYLVMTEELARAGCTAEPHLWGQAASNGHSTQRGDDRAAAASE